MDNYSTTQAYITTLTGDPNTVVDFRCIHDTDKAVPGKAIRSTLAEAYQMLLQYNQNGYGIFCCINAMDGQGRNLENVDHVRTHVVDLDNLFSAQTNYEKATTSEFVPHFAVQTSPGKYHLYWLVEPYKGNEFYSTHQRKIRQLYDGDRSVIDASRVLRLPGFNHLKDPANPFLVHCWQVGNVPRYTCDHVEQSLAHVNVFDSSGGRTELGTESLAAPSLDWLRFGLSKVSPQDLSYEEWMSLTAAYKQSGWTLTDPQTLLDIWLEWCGTYHGDDLGVNMKLWDSIKDTEIGWASIKRRTSVDAYMKFGHKEPPVENTPAQTPPSDGRALFGEPVTAQGSFMPVPQHPVDTPMPTPPEQNVEEFGEILGHMECEKWFEDCYFIEREGKMFSPSARFMNATQFNGTYGGKHFIITSTGKTTDEAWKAALRSTVWTVPKADHIRFLPTEAPQSIVTDDLRRKGLNTYIPADIKHRPGDVTPWLEHVAKIIPDPGDQKIWFDYLAHCVKFPGHKIPWAPMMQSMEGVGKSVFLKVMQHSLGKNYVYIPKADQLISSSNVFNAWMRGKLLIVVNEIKIDERRELIEILKPMITDSEIEVQSKGVDQDMEDNVANWLFFSNYKDAIPINQNGRRYSIFYSVIQTLQDLNNAGMTEAYFNNLFKWLEGGGYDYIADWFLNYPIEAGEIPVRAPQTSSHAEALKISRSPIEVIVHECVSDNMTGFKGGYISSLALKVRCKASGVRTPSASVIKTCLEGMGFYELGKASKPHFQEDVGQRTHLFGVDPLMGVEGYGAAQGYE